MRPGLAALLTIAMVAAPSIGATSPARLDPEPVPPPLPPRPQRNPRPDLRTYDGPKVAHVETKGTRKPTRRERKARQ